MRDRKRKSIHIEKSQITENLSNPKKLILLRSNNPLPEWAIATPMLLDNSSIVPRASKKSSDFGLRSPVNREELPPSPVFV